MMRPTTSTQYRPIQPGRAKETLAENEPAALLKSSTLLPPRRVATQQACDNCRTRKSRVCSMNIVYTASSSHAPLQCSGTKPRCRRCLKHGYECHYSHRPKIQAPKTAQTRAQFLEQLETTPEQEQHAISIYLRQATGFEAIIAPASDDINAMCTQVSLNATFADYVLGDSANAIRYLRLGQVLYPTSAPLNISALSSVSLLRPLSSGISSANAAAVNLKEGLMRGLGYQRKRSRISKSGSAAEINVQADNDGQPNLCDVRLWQLSIGHWTSQHIDNDLAARAISCYLTLSHPFFAFFEPNLFLDDLIAMRLQYCSAFLVNSLMAYACVSRLFKILTGSGKFELTSFEQSYAVYDSRSAYFSALFISEAATLWRTERSSDNIVNISAMMLLSLACSLEATDVSVLELLDDACQMAARMQLFHHTDENAVDVSLIDSASPQHMEAMAYTAWGAYNWLT